APAARTAAGPDAARRRPLVACSWGGPLVYLLCPRRHQTASPVEEEALESGPHREFYAGPTPPAKKMAFAGEERGHGAGKVGNRRGLFPTPRRVDTCALGHTSAASTTFEMQARKRPSSPCGCVVNRMQ